MQMIIGGSYVDSSDKKTFNIINPANGKTVDTIPAATPADIELAVQNAVKGQKEWNKIPLYQRLSILTDYTILVKKNRERIAVIMCEEGGKPIEQCRTEVDANIAIFQIYISAANTFYGHTLPFNAEQRSMGDIAFTVNEPLGVFACIAPFNYPFELAAHKTAPMLVTGNSVILKPSSDTPRSAIILVELLLEAGVTPNAIQCVTGNGAEIGRVLSEHRDVAAISFTGSTKVGIQLARQCSEQLKRCYLELGGNDPLVIFDDCDLDLAVTEAINGRIGNAGQTCCASKRFIVQNGIREQFAKVLIERLSAIKMGDPSDTATQLGPVINENAAIEVERQLSMTCVQGGKVVLGGERKDAFIPPTVIMDVSPDMDIARNMEVFGPVFPIIGFDTAGEALEIANATEYGLSSGVITGDMKTALKVATGLQAGACIINGSGNYRLAHQPFGGYKMSGVGREGAVATLMEMTQAKTVSFKGVLN